MAKPPPGLDMFGEMDWKKKAKAEKKKWEESNACEAAAAKASGPLSESQVGAQQQSQMQQKSLGSLKASEKQYGSAVGGKWVMGKPPPGLDMFGEMAWQKRAKAEKKKWEESKADNASPTDQAIDQPIQKNPQPEPESAPTPEPKPTSEPEKESVTDDVDPSRAADTSLNEAETMMAAMAAEKQAKLDKAKAERKARRAKKKEEAAKLAAVKPSTTDASEGSGIAMTMPEGLSLQERIRWKKEHPEYKNTTAKANGKSKGKPAVASRSLDQDMPDEIRNGSKLDQLRWRKKHAQEQDRQKQPSE